MLWIPASAGMTAGDFFRFPRKRNSWFKIRLFAMNTAHYVENHGYETRSRLFWWVHTIRYAGLFNLPIPMRCAFGIGVSQFNIMAIT
jgi:hypothetical protein